MSVIAALMERYMETQQDVDAKRRQESLYYFQAATVRKAQSETHWTPANIGFQGHRRYPNISIDNWSAAFKVRNHWEEMTELRKSQGKTIF